MKLAEALTERKALQEKLARLRARLAANARVQEGDVPAERPEALLGEIGDAAAALEALIVRINRTNVTATLADEPRLTLMEAVARRDMLKVRFAALSELVAAAQPSPQRFAMTRSGIRYRATVDVAELQKQVDALAREIRELDTRLQAANWMVDLVITRYARRAPGLSAAHQASWGTAARGLARRPFTPSEGDLPALHVLTLVSQLC